MMKIAPDRIIIYGPGLIKDKPAIAMTNVKQRASFVKANALNNMHWYGLTTPRYTIEATDIMNKIKCCLQSMLPSTCIESTMAVKNLLMKKCPGRLSFNLLDLSTLCTSAVKYYFTNLFYRC